MANSLKKLSIVLFSAFLAALFMEFIGAPYLFFSRENLTREQILLNFTAAPNTVIDNVEINEQGFTGDVYTKAKPPDTLRLLTLGGSVMFNDNITLQLKEHLQKISDNKIELQGAGLRSHTSASSLIKYQQFYGQFDIDYVLIYHGINDLWTNHVAIEDFTEDYSHYINSYKRNFLLDNSVLARVIYNAFASAPPPYQHNGANFASAKTFEQNLRFLIAAIKKSGATPVLMTFAWHIPEGYSKAKFENFRAGYNRNSLDNNADLWPVEIWGDIDYVKTGLNKHNAIIKSLAQELSIPLIDQHSLLSNNIDNFGDICHFSNRGRQQFIQNIASHLQRQLSSPKKKAS